MYPNGIYFGLKVVPNKVLWGHSRNYLGTWTLREKLLFFGDGGGGGRFRSCRI